LPFWAAAPLTGAALAQPTGKTITLVVPVTCRRHHRHRGRACWPSQARSWHVGGGGQQCGANGNIAGNQADPADGSSLLVQYWLSQHHPTAAVSGFDPGDPTPLSNLTTRRSCWWCAATSSWWPTLPSSWLYAKANPGKVNYASSGNGALQHVTTELLWRLTKTYMVHISSPRHRPGR
jgi:hypothetical protein